MLYGAAEFSRDLDLAITATDETYPRLAAAMDHLHASVIAVPPFERDYLARGHAVHFHVPDVSGSGLRVDIMSRMRGVDAFEGLWERRATLLLPSRDHEPDVAVDIMGLADLVHAKKTQRDKDWPMIRRLVDASYAAPRDAPPSTDEIAFWLSELRSPEFIEDAVSRYSGVAAQSQRGAVHAAIHGADIAAALAAEQATEMARDREYWAPLRRELERLRHAARRE